MGETGGNMIPRLDWQRFSVDSERDGVLQDVSRALRDAGIARLCNHGIDPALIAEVFSQADRVFELTEAEKRTLSMRPGRHNRGWVRSGSERLSNGTNVLERREGFNIGLELPPGDSRVLTGQPFRGETPWPQIPGFRETMLDYFDAMLALGTSLHRAIALDLGLREDYFEPLFTDPLATLRLITYPPGTGRDGETGAGVHSDFGALSLLLTDDVPGLEVQLRNGTWIEVKPEQGSFLILVGDVLAVWSAGAYVATPHRVVLPGVRRRAVSFHFDPAPDAPVAPLPELSEGDAQAQSYADYLAGRLAVAHRR